MMTAKAMSEDQMVHLLRNALLVAGHEIGPIGDHWPVVNSTIHGIMNDFEDVKTERNVFSEVKKYYADMIEQLVVIRNGSVEESKAELDSAITEIRAIYRACFEHVADDDLYLSDEDMPEHLQRAEAILNTLEEDEHA